MQKPKYAQDVEQALRILLESTTPVFFKTTVSGGKRINNRIRIGEILIELKQKGFLVVEFARSMKKAGQIQSQAEFAKSIIAHQKEAQPLLAINIKEKEAEFLLQEIFRRIQETKRIHEQRAEYGGQPTNRIMDIAHKKTVKKPAELKRRL